jgi:hypothetical protein
MARVNVKQTMPSEVSVQRDKEKEKAIQEVLNQILPDAEGDDNKGKSNKKTSEDMNTSCVESESLAIKVRERFKEAESSRKEVEQRWLKDLRQYRGQYDPDVLSRIHPNRSKAFIRITRNKVKTVDSRLVDLLFPANGDSNWSIKPTTFPQLSPDHLKQIMMLMKQSGAQQVTR